MLKITSMSRNKLKYLTTALTGDKIKVSGLGH